MSLTPSVHRKPLTVGDWNSVIQKSIPGDSINSSGGAALSPAQIRALASTGLRSGTQSSKRATEHPKTKAKYPSQPPPATAGILAVPQTPMTPQGLLSATYGSSRLVTTDSIYPPPETHSSFPGALRALYRQWHADWSADRSAFGSATMWAEVVLQQMSATTASLPEPNPIRLPIAAMVLDSIAPVFGSAECIFRTCLAAFLNATYLDWDAEKMLLSPLSGVNLMVVSATRGRDSFLVQDEHYGDPSTYAASICAPKSTPEYRRAWACGGGAPLASFVAAGAVTGPTASGSSISRMEGEITAEMDLLRALALQRLREAAQQQVTAKPIAATTPHADAAASDPVPAVDASPTVHTEEEVISAALTASVSAVLSSRKTFFSVFGRKADQIVDVTVSSEALRALSRAELQRRRREVDPSLNRISYMSYRRHHLLLLAQQSASLPPVLSKYGCVGGASHNKGQRGDGDSGELPSLAADGVAASGASLVDALGIPRSFLGEHSQYVDYTTFESAYSSLRVSYEKLVHDSVDMYCEVVEAADNDRRELAQWQRDSLLKHFRAWRSVGLSREKSTAWASSLALVKARKDLSEAFYRWKSWVAGRKLINAERVKQKAVKEARVIADSELTKLQDQIASLQDVNEALQMALDSANANRASVDDADGVFVVDALKAELNMTIGKVHDLHEINSRLLEERDNYKSELTTRTQSLRTCMHVLRHVMKELVAPAEAAAWHSAGDSGHARMVKPPAVAFVRAARTARELLEQGNDEVEVLPSYAAVDASIVVQDGNGNDSSDVVPEELLEGSAASASTLLLHWFTGVLQSSGKTTRTVKNFTQDLCDSENYTVLLFEVFPGAALMASQNRSYETIQGILDRMEKATFVIRCASVMSIGGAWLAPDKIVESNRSVNFALVSALFRRYLSISSPNNGAEFDDLIASHLHGDHDLSEDSDKKLDHAVTVLDRTIRPILNAFRTTQSSWHAVERHVSDDTVGTLVAQATGDATDDSGAAALVDLPLYTRLKAEAVMELCGKQCDLSSSSEEIKMVLESHWKVLRNIYNYYASLSSSSTKMIGTDFWRFVEDCKLPGKLLPRSNIDVIFIRCNYTREDISVAMPGSSATAGKKPTRDTTIGGHDKELDPNEFIECICRMAVAKIQKEMSSSQKIEKFIVEEILPKAMSQDVDEMKRIVYSAPVQQAIQTYHKHLLKIFNYYKDADASGGKASTLNHAEFSQMCKDTDLVDKTLTRNAVSTIFYSSQDSEDADGDAEMSFREFMEAIITLALFKVPNPMQPIPQRITMFITRLLLPPLRSKISELGKMT